MSKLAVNWNFNNRDLKKRLAIYKDKQRQKAKTESDIRREVCARLKNDVDNFLASGGTIEELPTYRDDPMFELLVDHACALN